MARISKPTTIEDLTKTLKKPLKKLAETNYPKTPQSNDINHYWKASFLVLKTIEVRARDGYRARLNASVKAKQRWNIDIDPQSITVILLEKLGKPLKRLKNRKT